MIRGVCLRISLGRQMRLIISYQGYSVKLSISVTVQNNYCVTCNLCQCNIYNFRKWSTLKFIVDCKFISRQMNVRNFWGETEKNWPYPSITTRVRALHCIYRLHSSLNSSVRARNEECQPNAEGTKRGKTFIIFPLTGENYEFLPFVLITSFLNISITFNR